MHLSGVQPIVAAIKLEKFVLTMNKHAMGWLIVGKAHPYPSQLPTMQSQLVVVFTIVWFLCFHVRDPLDSFPRDIIMFASLGSHVCKGQILWNEKLPFLISLQFSFHFSLFLSLGVQEHVGNHKLEWDMLIEVKVIIFH